MQVWQEGLIALAVLWACQGAGTWAQMRHYRRMMSGVSERWPDGYVGAGAARATFGRGVVALVVASPDQRVREVFLMEGRSVFAKFRSFPDAVGYSLDALPSSGFATAYKGRQKALTGAVSQIGRTIATRVRPHDTLPAAAPLAA